MVITLEISPYLRRFRWVTSHHFCKTVANWMD
jgi:hypothetical protein